MLQKSAIYIVLIAVLAVCLLAAIGVLFMQASGTPVIPGSLFNPTVTAAPTTTVSIKVVVQPALSTATPLPVETATHSVQTCGMSGTMDLLSIGRDAYFWESPYGADAIRLIRLDFSNRTAAIFAFPRDLVLPTHRLAEPYGIDSARLGKVYLAVLEHERGTSSLDALAAGTIAQVLKDNFDVRADHYVILEEDILGKVVNLFGGIDVDVPSELAIGSMTIPAGMQHMDGITAQFYTRRLNSTNEEWERFGRQNRVVDGLRRKLAQPDVLAKVPEIYSQFQDSVVTDLSPSEIVTLACAASEIPAESVTFETIRREMVTVHDNGAITMNDPEEIEKLLRALGF